MGSASTSSFLGIILLIILTSKNTTNAIIKKLMTELIKEPYLKVALPTFKTRLEKSICPKKTPISGFIKLLTNDLTIAVNAAPIKRRLLNPLHYHVR